MKDIIFYFQVHQPTRLRSYSVFDVGHSSEYFDDAKNREILNRVVKKSYLPMNKLLLKLITKFPNINFNFSLTGELIEQLRLYNKKALDSFKALFKTGNIDLLSETYNHSLAFLYSKKEFIEQIKAHKKAIKEEFGYEPRAFRNTELIFNNDIAEIAGNLGYSHILAEGVERVASNPNYVYGIKKGKNKLNIKVLLRNYKLSDDIAFRYSNKSWKHWPLHAEKFVEWLKNEKGKVIGLFMDYETFGEHQWEDSGIFDFFEELIVLLADSGFNLKKVSEIDYEPKKLLDVRDYVSWADEERDLSAWQGNRIQKSALGELKKLEQKARKAKDKKLLRLWRKLQQSDLFYYMCIKRFNDGDVHKYFNPFENPYDAYISYMNCIQDLKTRLEGD
jgi:alpha-amylase